MCGANSGTLLFGSDINKTKRAIQKAIREIAAVQLSSLSESSSDKEMGKPERITLGYYGRLETIGEVGYGFKTMNPVLFDINHSVLVSLR